MLTDARKRLNDLRDELRGLPSYPWSPIATWAAKAIPIIRNDWPNAHEDFGALAVTPKWVQPNIALGGSTTLNQQVVARAEQATKAANAATAEDAKARILGFLEGLMVSSAGQLDHESAKREILHTIRENQGPCPTSVSDELVSARLGFSIAQVRSYFSALGSEKKAIAVTMNATGHHATPISRSLFSQIEATKTQGVGQHATPSPSAVPQTVGKRVFGVLCAAVRWAWGHPKLSLSVVTLVVIALCYYIYYCQGLTQFKQDRVLAIANSDVTDGRGDIIFVHGLTGDAKTTWQADNSTFFWPESLGKRFPNIGIWSIDYDACFSELRGGTMPITDRSKNLLTQLTLKGIGRRPLIFVGHSLGGIMIKQMLRDANEQNNPKWQGIATETKGVVFLAAPHGGSDWATFVTSLERIAKVAEVSVSVRELEKNAAPLRDLNVWYRNNIPQQGVETQVFYEQRATPGLGALVVDQGSADPGINGVTPIAVGADHRTICKPACEDDLVYGSVADLIATHLLQAPPAYNVSFTHFVEEFGLVRHDAAKLAVFKKEHVGRKVKWAAIVKRVMPDAVSPAYVISPTADTPSRDHVLASFSTQEFETPTMENASITVEGKLAESSSESGAVLEECRIIRRASKASR